MPIQPVDRVFATEAERDAFPFNEADRGRTIFVQETGAYQRVTSIDAGSASFGSVGGGLSVVSFGVSWSGGNGDFKLTAAMPTETFSLSTILAGTVGALVAIEVKVTEAFASIGTQVGFTMGPEAVQPSDWFNWVADPPGPELFSLSTAAQGIYVAAVATGRTNINRAPAPQIQIVTGGGAGPNLNLASAGEATIALHYLPTSL